MKLFVKLFVKWKMRVRAREISVSSDSQSASENEINENRGRSSRRERAGRREVWIQLTKEDPIRDALEASLQLWGGSVPRYHPTEA